MLSKFLNVIFYSNNKTKPDKREGRRSEFLSLGPAIAEDVTIVIEKDVLCNESVVDSL
jgi:hypothetical protein